MTNPEDLKKLEQKIAMGMSKHILVYGVLLWGIPTAIFYAAITPLFTGKGFIEALSFSLWAFPLGGIFYGLYSWLKTKNLLEKAKS
ncbi:hypothetical protein [Grimontia sp. NTOU-MAR1]|uniref:hypothetical protein n=1 Tax=Grimontia sp. NTOU-MAR1 TaxID=3111011 RepID=UPI002DB6B9E7|nr:hypothetical protein [Grimontia sp. NTOU-MAR1]WRV98279.1 hypothetical protein VP504_02245 [Grimontia sp. NTOU-MAR1]